MIDAIVQGGVNTMAQASPSALPGPAARNRPQCSWRQCNDSHWHVLATFRWLGAPGRSGMIRAP